ncbi:MAG TPA: RT0821/Lpp0805 family surface protein [Povalibacter sp.]
MKNIRVALMSAALILLPSISHTAGLGFLNNAPISYFTDADLKLMHGAVLEVLNDADGTTVREWKNPSTGYSGKVQGMGKFRTADGLDCRKIKVWNQAKGIESESVYPVCRAAGADWRLASGKELLPV